MRIAKLGMAAIAALVVAGGAAGAYAQGPHGDMMGMGGRHGMKGDCGQREKPLTVAQAKDIVEGQLAWRGEELKVGTVTEKDGLLVAEVTKPTGEVVRHVSIDPKTGHFRRSE